MSAQLIKKHINWLCTPRYRRVMRDQRCLWPESIAFKSYHFSDMGLLCSPRTDQPVNTFLVSWAAPTTHQHTSCPNVNAREYQRNINDFLEKHCVAHPNHILLRCRMRLRNHIKYRVRHHQRRPIWSPRTYKIVVVTIHNDYWPPAGIIWDEGHTQKIGVCELGN
jgi:hypothetical protein